MKLQTTIRVGALTTFALNLALVCPARAADPAPGSPPARAAAVETVLNEIELRDATLRDALSLIGAPSGLNLAASDDAAKVKVNIRLRNVTPYDAVAAICQTNGLYFKKPAPGEIGIVTTVKEFQEGLTIFRDEKTKVFTMLYPNAMDLAVAIRDLFGDRVRLSLGKEGVYNESDELQRRFSTFDQLDSRSQGLTQSLSSGGSSGGGNSSNSSSNSRSGGGGGSSVNLVGSGATAPSSPTPQSQNELQKLSPAQVERVAALIRQSGAGVGVDADKLTGIGRNNTTIFVTVLNQNNQVIVRTSDPAVLAEITDLKEKIDIPTPQVLLEVKVLSVDLTDGFRSMFDFQYGNQNNAVGFSTGNILPNPISPSLSIGGTGGAPPFGLNPSSLIYQYVSDNFRLRMQLLENTNRVTALATPMLLVANHEVSRVFIGQERPIVQNISSQTTATQGVITSTPNTQITFRPVGTTLLITPNINADRTVTLRMIQETSSIIPGGASIPVVGSNGTVTNQAVDVVSAKTLTGTLIAKDGLTLALGGLIDEGVQDTREEVPILGKLPLVGPLFRRQVTGRYRSETIIVIRPFILSTPSEVQAVSKQVTDVSSIHTKASELYPEQGQPIGGMNTYVPSESVRPNPPKDDLEKIFQFHAVLPTDF